MKSLKSLFHRSEASSGEHSPADADLSPARNYGTRHPNGSECDSTPSFDNEDPASLDCCLFEVVCSSNCSPTCSATALGVNGIVNAALAASCFIFEAFEYA